MIVKTLVGTFNKEKKSLLGEFSEYCEGSLRALLVTSDHWAMVGTTGVPPPRLAPDTLSPATDTILLSASGHTTTSLTPHTSPATGQHRLGTFMQLWK